MACTAETIALEEWFREHSSHLHPGVQIQQDNASGVHYRAVAPIEACSMLAAAPHSITLSYLNALVDDAVTVFKQQRDQFTVEAIGFFYLMTQYINCESSFWKPYLDTLPRPESSFSQPLFFDHPEDQLWLEGTDVWHTVIARTEVYERYYTHGIAVLQQAGIDVRPYTWHLFKWAVTIFTSRSFSSRALHPERSKYWTTYKSTAGGRREAVLLDMSQVSAADLDFPVLFPGLDAANHSAEARVDWTFDPARFSINTNDSINAGSEVFNNYGPKGNGELLIGYGFCIPGNPYDTVALTLKAPSERLQQRITHVQPGYFTPDGEWDNTKATFHLRHPPASVSNPGDIFQHLPEALLELLVYILRDERSLPFQFLPEPFSYLNSEGSRYLPHVARMIVRSLISKLSKLDAVELPSVPQNPKQRQAGIYRRGQVSILQAWIAALRKFTQSLLWHPSADHASTPTGPCLVKLEDMITAFLSNAQPDDAFLQGIEASANTTDLTQLRMARCEHHTWVLLLCCLNLNLNSGERDGQRTRSGMWPEYISASTRRTGVAPDTEDQSHAKSLLDIVSKAAQECPRSSWNDRRWTAEYIASVGGRILQHDSFMIMCQDDEGREEARLCVYLHSL